MHLLTLALFLPLVLAQEISEESSTENGIVSREEEPELGIQSFEEVTEQEDAKKFESKALIDPKAFYYVFKNGKDSSYGYGGSTRASRPSYQAWKPIFTSNTRAQQQQPSWPRTSQSQPPLVQYPSTYATSLAQRYIPDQLRSLGFRMLADLIERAGLTEALKSPGPYTVFAPTDRAFQKFIGQRGAEYRNDILSDKTLLQNILLQHVASGRLRSNDLVDEMKIRTLADNTLNILDTRDGLTVAGSLFTQGGLNQLALNGIIHSINDVIYPYVSDEESTTRRPSITRFAGQRSDDPELIVRIQPGRVRGIPLSPEVRAWLGIPYAEPPVGRFRFSRPRQVKPWDRDLIKEASSLPKACPQTPDEFFGNFSGSQQWNPNTRIDEDCLYLNVFTPAGWSRPRG